MDVSPKMVFSVATAMIPFLENDDANRALMGSNMQRQAVPLLVTEAPAVGTGMEMKAAVDSGNCVIAEEDGIVTRSASNEIIIKSKSGEETYKLAKFQRSNQGTSMNHRPIVDKGEEVKAGQVIADGPSTCGGEIALGKNPLIGFMTWEGYNYEDAVLLSERLVQDDIYTSVQRRETPSLVTKRSPVMYRVSATTRSKTLTRTVLSVSVQRFVPVIFWLVKLLLRERQSLLLRKDCFVRSSVRKQEKFVILL